MALNNEAPGHMAFEDVSRTTQVLPVDASALPRFLREPDGPHTPTDSFINSQFSQEYRHLQVAAKCLKTSDIPVAFPTETVYGLGADATRSSAVRGIYKAKQRPSDNPLIVHIASLQQLRQLLRATRPSPNRDDSSNDELISDINGTLDPIPSIYLPLIQKFWPGPLTIILPKPQDSVLAPEVTAGLNTFGARMPRNALALALIKEANVPVAAPSANASTRPSPTAAEHVLEDLDGRIDYILDGGPCEVGVESTVVDGLSGPPLILRPGGISIDELRSCPGWENVSNGYKENTQVDTTPRAPGMKYRHYSPKAAVVLYEFDAIPPSLADMTLYMGEARKVGLIRTKAWPTAYRLKVADESSPAADAESDTSSPITQSNGDSQAHASVRVPSHNGLHQAAQSSTLEDDRALNPRLVNIRLATEEQTLEIWEVDLGREASTIARRLFSALRELDRKGVETILIEGLADDEGDLTAAVMNRLRKAARTTVSK